MNTPILDLQQDDAPFCKNPAESFTLPARYYQDEEILQHEKKAIFHCNWWYAGHISQLPDTGDYLTTEIDEQSVFVVRSKSGGVQAFYNVCQHRGHELVSGSGNARVFVCPYHAWSYDLDGQLKAARNTDQMPGFTKCDF